MKIEEIKVVDSLKIDDIAKFSTHGDKVIMVLKNGQEVVFNVMKEGFDRYFFFEMLRNIQVTEREIFLVNFVFAERYTHCGQEMLKMNEIKKILKEMGVDEYPDNVFWKLLEDFRINILKETNVDVIKASIRKVFPRAGVIYG